MSTVLHSGERHTVEQDRSGLLLLSLRDLEMDCVSLILSLDRNEGSTEWELQATSLDCL